MQPVKPPDPPPAPCRSGGLMRPERIVWRTSLIRSNESKSEGPPSVTSVTFAVYRMVMPSCPQTAIMNTFSERWVGGGAGT